MNKLKINILVIGLLKTGSSALIDLLREYDNINLIPGEFDDFRAPGLVADQLSYQQSVDFINKIEVLIESKQKLLLIYNILPIYSKGIHSTIGIRGRFVSSLIRIRQLRLLKKLNIKLSSNISFDDKIRHANKWITEIGLIYNKDKEFILYNQPLEIVNNTGIWSKVFHPWKLVIVYREPKDQLADIIKNGYLYEPYGAPFINFGGVTLETIYGRSREGAITFHIDAIRKRLEWLDSLKKELDADKFLLIDFEGLVNNYDAYKTAIENFIGNLKPHHKNQKLHFDPMNAKKSINIYKEYLSNKEIESLKELENWYKNMINRNQVLY